MVVAPSIVSLPSPNHADIALWLIDLDAHPEWCDAPWLSISEQDRASRFRFDLHARRYRASHAALRLILGQAMGLDPSTLEFTEGTHGKPRLLNINAPCFNMSHSAGWALVGLCPNHPIGVDIELIAPMADAPLLAQKNFSASEYAVFLATPPDQQLQAFFRCWTRKEACLKALGSGLSIEPHEFEAGLGSLLQRTFIAIDGQACAMTVSSIDLPIPAMAAFAKLADANSPLAM
ncbi:4'-phosphopantetheinyl transferase superfamily protein [Aquabacterium sp.]|uniref:4'-phosphopantetheinyl transferase family protein n=1 Tax=Aquabacterium sp. TaxID=1872578 RepID=UPI0019A37266|nr:4'-phosphopantetheinyl transferase superfamily protein [Aquabacterium sp.]MBC7698925.1 4'-phosphopantetheinyl transferase superfamily protein [Aquabacterium sp.]